MTVTFALNETDNRARQEEFAKTASGRNHRRTMWLVFWVTTLLCPVGIFYAYAERPQSPGLATLNALPFLLFAVAAYFRARRPLLHGASKTQTSVTVGEAGLISSVDSRPGHVLEWSNVMGWTLDAHFVRLRYRIQIGGSLFIRKEEAEDACYIPRRAFATDGEMYAFLALIDRYRGVSNAQTAQTAPVAVPAANVGAWYQSRTGVDTGQETENAATLRRSRE